MGCRRGCCEMLLELLVERLLMVNQGCYWSARSTVLLLELLLQLLLLLLLLLQSQLVGRLGMWDTNHASLGHHAATATSGVAHNSSDATTTSTAIQHLDRLRRRHCTTICYTIYITI